MNKKIILSHSGKQHSYHVATSLLDLGCLGRFYTSSYIRPAWLQEIILRRNNQYWSRRFQPGLFGSMVESNWRFEFKEITYGKLFGQGSKTLKAVYERDVSFDRYMARKLGRLDGDIFWGFQGSCLESIKAAKKSGKKTICELSTAHAPTAIQVLNEEKRLNPEWADSFDNLEFPPGYLERLCDEPAEADWVIGASGFTIRSLEDAGIQKEKTRYLPLGFDVEQIKFSDRKDVGKRPLKLLYAGRVTQRKGIKYLLEAMRAFDRRSVELHVIGHVQGSGAGLQRYEGLYNLHPPLSQSQLFEAYHDYDALVLPSVFEGFGLVIVEAMAAGLPVITTPNSIGPEVITDGVDGYIVPIRDVNAIERAINDLQKKDRTQVSEMRLAAQSRARQFSWPAYTERLKVILDSI